MSIGIADIGVYIPEGRLDNLARAEELQTDQKFLDEKIGTCVVSRRAEGEDTSDLAVKACERLFERGLAKREEVDCVVLCTQNPDGCGIPHTSSIVHAKLGLRDECACFDISLGCSGFVYGLSVAAAFMESNGLKCGLLVTADPYSKIIDSLDRNTVLLFGDGAAATLLRPEGGGAIWIPRGFSFATRGNQGGAIKNPTGTLEMNGRAVFEFCMTAVPPQIRGTLEKFSLGVEDVDAFLLHQGSRFIVEQMARMLRVPVAKVPLGIEGVGNTVSSSIPILLENWLNRQGVKRLVISGFGVGLSWATGLLEKVGEKSSDAS